MVADIGICFVQKVLEEWLREVQAPPPGQVVFFHMGQIVPIQYLYLVMIELWIERITFASGMANRSSPKELTGGSMTAYALRQPLPFHFNLKRD
jgi:hypothetical protein